MNRQGGWAFLDTLKNVFFLLLFLQALPFLIVGIKNNIDGLVHSKIEVGYINLKDDFSDAVSYIKRIEEFEQNSSIEGLIIKVDSPGGLPGSSQAIFHSLQQFQQKKPIVVFVENLCVSGAYYAVCGATKIIANESALVGRIGNALKASTVKEFFDGWKIKQHNAQLLSAESTDSEEIRLIYQDFYDQFVCDVSMHRGLNKEAHLMWANGKIFTGNQALEIKLVDQLGSYVDALDAMAALLHKDRNKIKLIAATQGIGGFMRRFMGSEEYGSEMNIARIARLALGI